MIEFYGYRDAFAAYQNAVVDWGVWIIIAKAFTPIPFKVAAIGAGVAAMDPIAFMVATVFGRALHFVMVGAAIILFGDGLSIIACLHLLPQPISEVLCES